MAAEAATKPKTTWQDEMYDLLLANNITQFS